MNTSQNQPGNGKNYFAAANTYGGFVSYYDSVFGDCKRIYIIKGGSGTGKNRLMREVAAYALKLDPMRNIEYFYCSFDPHSLDGIIIDGETAVIDGTAPHVYEPSLPGAKENLIDLGNFWDENTLLNHLGEINDLMQMKKEAFANAYACLASAGKIRERIDKVKEKYVMKDKISAAAARIITAYELDKNGKSELRIRSAFGREGLFSYGGFEKISKRQFRISDPIGIGHYLLTAIKHEAERFRIDVKFSFSPLEKNKVDALLLGDNLSVEISSCDGADVNTDEFISDDRFLDSGKMLRLGKNADEILSIAGEFLSEASNIHFEIEKIYSSAMNFSRKEKYTEELLRKIVR